MTSYASGLGASTISGTRFLEDRILSGRGYHDIAVNVYDPSVMSDSSGYNVVGQTTIIWDGNSNSTIEYSMAPVDLTEGGQNTVIQIFVLSNDLAGNTFTLNFGDGTTNKDVSFTLPANSANIAINLSYAMWTGVDFSQIRGGGLFYQGVANEDFAIDYIAGRSVPEPSTFVLLGAGLIGAVVMRRRTRK